MTNVFEFPKDKIVREVVPNVEEVEKHKEKGRQNYADDIVVDFIDGILNTLDNYGVDTDGVEFEKDFSFAIEAVRATIYRSLSIKHHLHDFIENSVMVIKKDEKGNPIEFDISSDSEDIIINDAMDGPLRLDLDD